MDDRFIIDPSGELMVFWGIHSNLSEINVMKNHQAHKQAIC